jgi:ribA/ribD-fused uncharacterized protein
VVEIEFNGTRYNSAHQAIFAELAKSFNDNESLQKIMIADTPDEISYNLDDVPGDKESNEAKWNDLLKQLIYDVNITKFNQYPELAARLLETKNATIGAYLPNDNLIGIGISLDNIQSKNPINWTGQNILGKALMDIREKIHTERQIKEQTQTQLQSQPVQRKKRPVVSTQVSTMIPESTLSQQEESIPKAAISQQESIPRPIRRRPVSSIQISQL